MLSSWRAVRMEESNARAARRTLSNCLVSSIRSVGPARRRPERPLCRLRRSSSAPRSIDRSVRHNICLTHGHVSRRPMGAAPRVERRRGARPATHPRCLSALRHRDVHNPGPLRREIWIRFPGDSAELRHFFSVCPPYGYMVQLPIPEKISLAGVLTGPFYRPLQDTTTMSSFLSC